MDEPSNWPIYAVSDLIAVINQTLDYALESFTVIGEVSSFKINQNKYVFFDLKDSTGSLPCFMSVWQLRVPIEDGMKVSITATAKLTDWGKFSLTVKTIRPIGEGAIKKSLEILKNTLEKEGFFALERKRALPYLPKTVGVISSVQAAGYADFVKILDERIGGVKVEVAHVQVQGDVAADQMIRAIEYFNQRTDLVEVLVLIRGGGSADDLMSYNDEKLVRAVASSRIPILTGIGHETDVSLVDLVADKTASTPSNAAQMLVPDKHEIIRSTKAQIGGIVSRIDYAIDNSKCAVRDQIRAILRSYGSGVDRLVDQSKMMRRLIEQYDPDRVLARGYAILSGSMTKGSIIEIETSQLLINAEVRDVSRK
jgi:exodeoxyribonuclease VII large subunit